ncbi:helix-turn-helix domain-containing protein [Mesorhizobium japonicum]|uniref:helix-turn-helix domain-containing protein n=1 Tax=Mesorhizobium japonicum TaxID=2066070 RepID=UPI003B5B7CA1
MADVSAQYSTAEAAALLGVSPSTLRRYCGDGTLPEPGWIRVGRRRQRAYSDDWIREARRILSQ